MIDLLVGACDCVKVLECTRLIAFAGQQENVLDASKERCGSAEKRSGKGWYQSCMMLQVV